MTDLPVPCWAGLYSAQLLLALVLAALRLERAPRHDALRRVRGAAVLLAVLPVPGPGLLLGATALAALTLLRRRANDDARAACSRLTASPLRPGGYPGSGLPDPDLLAGRVPDLPALPDPQALAALPDPGLPAPPALADPADRGSTLPVLPATGPGPAPLGLPVLPGPGGGLPNPGLPAEHVLSAPTPGDRV